ncbi:hypothetical protein BMS3Abin01_00744 [bacterium BMS3Abin01]|nr:hypothetical protein BMS3Abin01_00744 [bacterium BMS3Abin01]HDZ59530.1 hypothetical protein [Actinomycetota bacterium]
MGKWCKKHPILAGLGFMFFGVMLAVIVAAYLVSLQTSTPQATRTSRRRKAQRGLRNYSRPIIAGASTPAVPAAPVDLHFPRWQRYLAQAIAITIGAVFAILITNIIAGLL